MTSLNSKVLITGASGFLASWISLTILERGGIVRATVRTKSKGEYLAEIFKDHGERFEYVIVGDMEKEGAFDDAVKGMGAVIHPASPFRWDVNDPQEILRPALKGTIGILESILRFGPTVKRVVITSSTVAVAEIPSPHDPPRTTILTEKNWNNQSIELLEQLGDKIPRVHVYRASKVIAERAAWEFVDTHREEIGWDLVTLHPGYLFGPVIHQVPSPSSLNTSISVFLAVMRNDPPLSETDLSRTNGYNYVDVRDVAEAHAEAVLNMHVGCKSKSAAFNEGKGRVLLSAHPFTWQDVVDVIGNSSTPLPQGTAKGKTGAGREAVHPGVFDTSRARDVLGLEFRSMQMTFVDMLQDLRAKGWVS